jgi:hypothetical protein
MVRRSFKRGKSGKVRNRTPWTYAHKGRTVVHPGRVWRWVRVEGVALMSIHKATNALGTNRAAGEEEAFRLVEWFEDHAGQLGAFGDANNQADDQRDDAPAHIAARAEAELVSESPDDIDLGIVRGMTGRWKRGKKYGSDHYSHTYEIEEI